MESSSQSLRFNWTRPVLFLVFAFLLAVAFALPFATTSNELKQYYYFDVDLTADHAGITQLFYDVGNGIVEGDSISQPLEITKKPRRYRYLLPCGVLKRLRFDLNIHEGHY